MQMLSDELVSLPVSLSLWYWVCKVLDIGRRYAKWEVTCNAICMLSLLQQRDKRFDTYDQT
jgi:hypothetical protein